MRYPTGRARLNYQAAGDPGITRVPSHLRARRRRCSTHSICRSPPNVGSATPKHLAILSTTPKAMLALTAGDVVRAERMIAPIESASSAGSNPGNAAALIHAARTTYADIGTTGWLRQQNSWQGAP
jgi:hypothetical protein